MNFCFSRIAGGAALLLTVFMASPDLVLAQDSPTKSEATEVNSYVKVKLNDGTLKFGTLLEMSDTEIVLQVAGLGATRIPKYLVQSIEVLEEDAQNVKEGYSYASNQASRYFFAPSGIQLEDGEGYFQSNIAYNSVSYGFGSKFTAGAMVSVLGLGLTAKYGGKVGENTYMSFGGITAIDFYGELGGPMGIVFANVTRGDENKHVTLNLGISNRANRGIVGLDWSNYTTTITDWGDTLYYPESQLRKYTNTLLINFSGMLPLNSNTWLITENYLLLQALDRTESEPFSGATWGYPEVGLNPYNSRASGDATGIVALGVRNYSSKSGWLWDWGLAGLIGDGYGAPVPWFSFTLEF